MDKNDVLNIQGENTKRLITLLIAVKKKIKISCKGKSMYPFFYDIDFIEVDPVHFENIETGDVILYYNKKSNLTCHRVIKKNQEKDNIKLITKGDFDSSIDNAIEKKDFIGKVVKIVSKNKNPFTCLGINKYLSSPIAKMSLISLYIWPLIKAVKKSIKK